MSGMKKLNFIVFFLFVKGTQAVGAYALMARVFARFVKRINADGSLSQASRVPDKTTALVLSREHFRGDVEILARREDLICLDLSTEFQKFLLACFVKEPTLEDEKKSARGIRWDFRAAKKGSDIYKGREKYRAFLEKFLPYFYDQFGIDVVVNSDERPRRQADLTRVSNMLGYPHISHQRESLFLSPALYDQAVSRHAYWGRFHGHKIVVQNDTTEQVFLDANYAPKNKIVRCGCLRMDDFIKALKTPGHGATRRPRKQVLMFTWQNSKRLADGTVFNIFDVTETCVRVLADIAKKRPDVDFVIKLKDAHLKGNVKHDGTNDNQFDILNRIVNVVAGSDDGLPNFMFSTDRMGAAELILSSDVVIGMQSTTTLESAVAGKPVIVPHFKSLLARKGVEEYIFYRDAHHLFDVPGDAQEMRRMVLDRLDRPEIDQTVMRQREELFERHVSPLSGTATEELIAILHEAALARRGVA